MKKSVLTIFLIFLILYCSIFFSAFLHGEMGASEATASEYKNQELIEVKTCGEKTVEKPPVFCNVDVVYELPPQVLTPFEKEKTSLGEFKLTAYCSCATCCEEYALNRPIDENGNQIVYTASGNRAVQGVTVAVDPAVIPYGTELEINGNKYIAQDCGGNIKENRIDVYFENHQDAWNFGTQHAEVFLCQ